MTTKSTSSISNVKEIKIFQMEALIYGMSGYEVCGYTDNDGKKFYIKEHQKRQNKKNQCNHDTFTREDFPNYWHTHPNTDRPYPSSQDIEKVIQKKDYANRLNTEIYVPKGIWRIGSNCSIANQNVLKEIRKKVDGYNGELMKREKLKKSIDYYDHAEKLDSLHRCLNVNFGKSKLNHLKVTRYSLKSDEV